MQTTSKFLADRATAEKAIRFEAQYYDVVDLAEIIAQYDFGCQELHRVLRFIWRGEKNRIHPKWHNRRKDFFLNLYSRLDYLQNAEELSNDWNKVKQEAEVTGHSLSQPEVFEDEYTLDLFFKELRLKLLYLGTQNYVRIKLRTLLSKYGYQRRTKRLVDYMKRSLDFYEIQTYIRGSEECDIGNVSINQYLTFRIK